MKTKLLYEKESYKIRGCFFAVYNELGFGHKEVVYQRALEEEFIRQNMKSEREVGLPVSYNGKKIAEYRPDFIISNKIIIEIKALEFMPKRLESQLVYYLKGTQVPLGFLVNFGSKPLQIIRKVWSKNYMGKGAVA